MTGKRDSLNDTWSEAEIRALGVKTDVETAGSIFGLSRTQSYEAVKGGRFPVEPVRVGRRMIVPTAPIRRLLGIDPQLPTAETEPAGAVSDPQSVRPLRVADDGSADAA